MGTPGPPFRSEEHGQVLRQQHVLVEQDLTPRELVARGFPADTVRRVSNLLDLAEYKRRQAPPGVKITAKAFGRDRRYPITNAFRRAGIAELERLPPTDAAD